MLAIIVGRNRVEICEIRRKDYDKAFFEHRKQLYMMMPKNLVRLRHFDEDGREYRDTEEVSIFPEGSSCAFDTLPDCEDDYYQEAVLPSIDLFRDVRTARIKGVGRLQAIQRTMNAAYPFLGVIILGIVVAYGILEGQI